MTTTKPRPIAPLDLVAERAQCGTALIEALERVLASGVYVLGPEVQAFEREFAAYQGAAHGVGVSSGTDALVVAMRALGLEIGAKVLTTPFTFFASAGAIAWSGARPTFVDVDPDTALMRLDQVAAALDDQTVGVVPVHLYGALVDIPALRAITDPKGLWVLEDGAQAHGAGRTDADGNEWRCGVHGHAAAFSFYPTKNLGAAGEGGMVLTQSGEVACDTSQIRDHGSVAKYMHGRVGTNSRLQAMQAAVLRVKLPHLDAWNARRREHAARYHSAFEGSQTVSALRVEPGTTHAFHQFAVRILGEDGARDRVQAALAAQGISAAVHYPRCVHVQEAAKDWGYGPGDFPGAEQLAREVLCLPIHPFLEPGDVDRVAEAVLTAAG
ncbi:DegT/DnrJ/EryC1/StrS family aminotransferase [Engelhardtia mirabilis]|uniref:Aminotransferase n=1 Tax=Engelhardtia mirabilis TaxID=2528011 RepID=A0A518BJ04_9BACT|nr:Aminotransferase [Planctomycetes bacterium Pla133]QDV01276.1 Aminotransferase [Planctomycetes bacterium Pla86]